MKKVIVVVGPTASGKTKFSLWLAKKINGTLLNGDSRQIFKDMILGTDQPTDFDVPHFLFGFKSPRSFFSVENWLAKVKKIIPKVKNPIVVGGTWFWIKSLIFGAKFPQVKPNLKLRKELEKLSLSELQLQLKNLDPQRFESLKENIHNKRRLIRAIEISLQLGKVIPVSFQPQFKFLVLGLKKPLNILEKEIEKRIKTSLKLGLLAEIKKLHLKYSLSYQKIMSFGNRYHWFTLYLLGKISLEEAILKTKKETLKYAKTQLREFNKLNPYWLCSYLQGLKLAQKFLKD